MREEIRRFSPRGAAAEARLLGLLSRPAGPPTEEGIVLLNAGIVHRIGPHRLNVKIARRLADAGSACLRFDLSGLGDSPPPEPGLSHEDQAVADVLGAVDDLVAATGAARVALVGLCSGADNAYRAALADARISALVLLDPFAYGTPSARIVRTIEKARDRHRWRRRLARLGRAGDTPPAPGGAETDRLAPPREAFGRDLAALTARGTDILILYTNYVEETLTSPTHFFGAFADFDFRGRLTVEVNRAADHTYTALAAQADLIRRLQSWFADRRTPAVSEVCNARR